MYQLVVFLNYIVNFYELLIVVWCLLTWVPIRQGGLMEDIATAIGRIVEPYLSLFRRLIPPLGGMVWRAIVGILL